MKIVIAGGTGFLGRPLARALADDRHDLAILTRGTLGPGASPTPRVRLVPWTPNGQAGRWPAEIDGADAVINLAGAPIRQEITELQLIDMRALSPDQFVRHLQDAMHRSLARDGSPTSMKQSTS